MLSPCIAHSVKWNRFWNSSGGKGRNIPLDLHLEHLNGFLKFFLKGLGPNLTEQTAARISKSIGILKEMMEHTDTELQVSGQTGAHHVQHGNDILVLMDIIKEVELFKHQPGREFAAFPGFKKTLLAKLNYRELWNWMRDKIKDWRNVPI